MPRVVPELPFALEQRILAVEQQPSAGTVLAAVVMGECAEAIAAPYPKPMRETTPDPPGGTSFEGAEQYIETIRNLWTHRQPVPALAAEETTAIENPWAVTPFTLAERAKILSTVKQYVGRISLRRVHNNTYGHANNRESTRAIRARLTAELAGFAAAPRILAGDEYMQSYADAVIPQPWRLPLSDLLSMPLEDFDRYAHVLLEQAFRLCIVTSRNAPQLLLLDEAGNMAHPDSILLRSDIQTLFNVQPGTKRMKSLLEAMYQKTILPPKRHRRPPRPPGYKNLAGLELLERTRRCTMEHE